MSGADAPGVLDSRSVAENLKQLGEVGGDGWLGDVVVTGDLAGGVAELPCGELGGRLLRHEGGDGLAERVRGYPVEARVLADLAPASFHVDDLVPGAVAGGEHGVEVVGRGELPPGAEHLGSEPGEYDGADARVRFRCRLSVCALAGLGLDRAGDRQRGQIAGEVEVAPAQREDLADTAAGSEQQVNDVGHVAGRLWARTVLIHPGVYGGAQLSQVFDPERLGLLLRVVDARGVAGRVDRDRVVADGEVEHRAEDDLGLALSVDALFAQLHEQSVEPAGGDFPQLEAAEGWQDEVVEDASVFVDRGLLDPSLGLELADPVVGKIEQSGFGCHEFAGRRRALRQHLPECPLGSSLAGARGRDAAGVAVVIPVARQGAPSVAADLLSRDGSPGSEGEWWACHGHSSWSVSYTHSPSPR